MSKRLGSVFTAVVAVAVGLFAASTISSAQSDKGKPASGKTNSAGNKGLKIIGKNKNKSKPTASEKSKRQARFREQQKLIREFVDEIRDLHMDQQNKMRESIRDVLEEFLEDDLIEAVRAELKKKDGRKKTNKMIRDGLKRVATRFSDESARKLIQIQQKQKKKLIDLVNEEVKSLADKVSKGEATASQKDPKSVVDGSLEKTKDKLKWYKEAVRSGFVTREPIVNNKPSGVKFRFVYIPPGTFRLGYSEDGITRLVKQTGNVLQGDNSTPMCEEVKVTEGFLILDREITEEQYGIITEGLGAKRSKKPKGGVSWLAANKFCDKLEEQGYAGEVDVRLPTEIEWEYAARGATDRTFPWRPRIGGSKFFAWAKSTAGGATHPRELDLVQSRDVSWSGVHDLAGNLCEWCSDLYTSRAYEKFKSPYEYTPSRVSEMLDRKKQNSSTERVYRGGSFRDRDHLCEISSRRGQDEKWADSKVGFRPVLIFRKVSVEEPSK